MQLRPFIYLFLVVLIFVVASPASGQALDISSGGLPTITGAINGSVTGNAIVTDDLVVTINFGEVSPLSAVVYGLVGLAGAYQALFWKRVQSRWALPATQHAR